MSDAVVVPAEIRPLLESELENFSGAVYTLRMFWLGRFDKFHQSKAPVFDWMTREFLPPELLANYNGGASGRVLFAGENHPVLAYQAVNGAVKALQT